MLGIILIIALSSAFLKLFAVANAKDILKLTITNRITDVSTHIILVNVGRHIKLMPKA
jgi:hypothetical protein